MPQSIEFINEPVQVQALLWGQTLQVQQIQWREQAHRVVNQGRQWLQNDRQFVLVELVSGARMELSYHHAGGWRLHRYWPVAQVA